VSISQSVADPERALSLVYAPPAVRPAVALLWRLDELLGSIIARTENPAVGQMRLTWWHDALRTLSISRPADPLLVELAATPSIDPHALLSLIDGWETLLDPMPLSDEALIRYAEARGGTLFGAAGTLLGIEGEQVQAAGRLWAMADLAFRLSDRSTSERALRLAPAFRGRLPGPLAPLAALAARDVRRGLDKPRRQGSPVRVARALWAGLTGY
jgi:15-cis-phytoene synthase